MATITGVSYDRKYRTYNYYYRDVEVDDEGREWSYSGFNVDIFFQKRMWTDEYYAEVSWAVDYPNTLPACHVPVSKDVHDTYSVDYEPTREMYEEVWDYARQAITRLYDSQMAIESVFDR